MKIVKLPKMEDKEIEEALKKENLCRIAFIEDKFPYISPFQYIYLNGALYFHLTDYGKKKKILEENNNICVSIEKFADDLSHYYFISMQGRLIRINKEEEIRHVLKKMIEKAQQNFSESFLSAHGYDKKSGWEGVVLENQLIYKLEQIGNPVGLKSL